MECLKMDWRQAGRKGSVGKGVAGHNKDQGLSAVGRLEGESETSETQPCQQWESGEGAPRVISGERSTKGVIENIHQARGRGQLTKKERNTEGREKRSSGSMKKKEA